MCVCVRVCVVSCRVMMGVGDDLLVSERAEPRGSVVSQPQSRPGSGCDSEAQHRDLLARQSGRRHGARVVRHHNEYELC